MSTTPDCAASVLAKSCVLRPLVTARGTLRGEEEAERVTVTRPRVLSLSQPVSPRPSSSLIAIAAHLLRLVRFDQIGVEIAKYSSASVSITEFDKASY